MMRKLKIKISAEKKKHLISFSIFFGIIFGLTVILVTFTLVSRNSWKAGLAMEMQHVLDSYGNGSAHYTVGKNIVLDSTLSTSAAVYSLLKKDDRKNGSYYGVIVRIPSILGPLPAVFVYNDVSGVFFAGYALDNGKASDAVDIRIENNVMNYWEKMIPTIISKAQVN